MQFFYITGLATWIILGFVLLYFIIEGLKGGYRMQRMWDHNKVVERTDQEHLNKRIDHERDQLYKIDADISLLDSRIGALEQKSVSTTK